MIITLKQEATGEIVKVKCLKDCGDSDYTVYGEDANGNEYVLVYDYEEDWDEYVAENENATWTGEAWEWLIINHTPRQVCINGKQYEDYAFDCIKVEELDVGME